VARPVTRVFLSFAAEDAPVARRLAEFIEELGVEVFRYDDTRRQVGRVVGEMEERLAAADLFIGPLETSLAEDELAVAAVFPTLPPGTGAAMVEVARRHGDYAMCGVVATVSLGDEGRVGRVRAGYLSAGDSPEPLDLSAPVAGSSPATADWAAVGELARGLVPTEPDIHASAEYRSQLVAVLTERAVRRAAARAQGQKTTDEGHAA